MARKETFKQQAIRVNDALNQRGMTAEEEARARAAIFPTQLIERSYRRRPIAYCSECGGEVHNRSLKECPHCGAAFAEKPQEQQKWEAGYHGILEAVDGLQVLRYVMVKRWTQYGKRTCYLVSEVMRHIYNDAGDRYVFHKNVQGLSMYVDAWCIGSTITIKQEPPKNGYYSKAQLRQNIDFYNIDVKSLTQQWQHKPIEDIIAQGDAARLRMAATPYGEMMMKCGYMSLFNYCAHNYRTLSKDEQTALRICHRNHYEIRDASLWLDYIGYLTHFRLDVHNAHFVCPADLREAHQVLHYRRERERIAQMAREEAERATRRLEQAIERNEKLKHWAEHMGAILGLSLTADNLTIRPLQSIEEFQEEGANMHHCVFSMGYYDFTKHPHCLILSAKDAAGNRLATIEYNTARHEIVQCRAACNQVPERDAEIRQLITDHRADIELLMRTEVATGGTKTEKKTTKKTAAVAVAAAA